MHQTIGVSDLRSPHSSLSKFTFQKEYSYLVIEILFSIFSFAALVHSLYLYSIPTITYFIQPSPPNISFSFPFLFFLFYSPLPCSPAARRSSRPLLPCRAASLLSTAPPSLPLQLCSPAPSPTNTGGPPPTFLPGAHARQWGNLGGGGGISAAAPGSAMARRARDGRRLLPSPPTPAPAWLPPSLAELLRPELARRGAAPLLLPPRLWAGPP